VLGTRSDVAPSGIRVDPAELRFRRGKRVITRKELADKAGVACSTCYALERGTQRTCRPETIRKIAAALSIRPERLVAVERRPR